MDGPAKLFPHPLYLSVGHTSNSTENTGIQRVTRSLARAAMELIDDLSLLAWHHEPKCFKYLSRDLLENLSQFGGPVCEAPNLEPLVPPPPDWIKYLPVPRFLRRRAREAFRNHHRRQLWRFSPRPGAWMVIPELVTEMEMRDITAYASRNNFQTAVIFHDSIGYQFPQWVNKKVSGNHGGYMRAIAAADCILPVSRFSADCYRKFAEEQQLTPPRIEVCENAAEFSACARVRQYDPPPAEQVFALCVSTLDPRKNHKNLLEAFDWLYGNYPEIPLHLTLVGNSYAGAEHIVREVEKICLRNPRVRWLRQVDDRELESLYLGSHFTIFPSRVEGYGLPIMESIWHGRPCICADEGVMAELAEGGGCLTVDVKDYRALALAMRQMASDRSLRESLAEKCLRRELRSWKNYAAELMQFLDGRKDR